MKVLLVSDDRAKNAAVVLTVNVGNLDDPYGLDGCAHLCEHMLFQGTVKYPLIEKFPNFLSENGGKFNGMTGEDRTIFSFDVAGKMLNEALDIFK